jgi:(S)-3,5-dihydroxyphenylglycine transaminase
MRFESSDLNPALGHPVTSVMNFLNEVTARHPDAISFGPGRPGAILDVSAGAAWIDRFIDHVCATRGVSRTEAWDSIGQYGATNGIINALVARHLEQDHGVSVDPRAIAITHGAQEAMVLVLCGIFRRDSDVLLVSEPSYIGMSGLARVLGIDTVPVRCDDDGLDLDALARAIGDVKRAGKHPRALYDIPDFHNPLGSSLPHSRRRALLDIAERERLLVIEDNPYGLFAYDEEPAPPLKALDTGGAVIYLGTFSKTMFPSVRVGYLVADQPLDRGYLAEELSKVKSLITVNTSQMSQALAGGILLESDCALKALVQPRLARYRSNRDVLLAALQRELGADARLARSVSWSRPRGGFFLTMTLPFACTDPEVEACAAEHGVIFCPVRWFASSGREDQIRLSFSSVTHAQIDEGVARLARYVRHRAS